MELIMKRLLALFLLPSITLGQIQTPITNGKLTTDLDAGGNNIQNVDSAFFEGAPVSDATQTALDAKRAFKVESGSFTALAETLHVVVATATATDFAPPSEGQGYTVLVWNGTATVGGTAYATQGTLIERRYHSGSWSQKVYLDSDQVVKLTGADQTIATALTLTGDVYIDGSLTANTGKSVELDAAGLVTVPTSSAGAEAVNNTRLAAALNDKVSLAGDATITDTKTFEVIAISAGGEINAGDASLVEVPTASGGDSAVNNTRMAAYSEPIQTAASQAEMEAGTEAAIRSMSPLRIKQAITALGGGGGGFDPTSSEDITGNWSFAATSGDHVRIGDPDPVGNSQSGWVVDSDGILTGYSSGTYIYSAYAGGMLLGATAPGDSITLEFYNTANSLYIQTDPDSSSFSLSGNDEVNWQVSGAGETIEQAFDTTAGSITFDADVYTGGIQPVALKGVKDPVDLQDAATKAYVDNLGKVPVSATPPVSPALGSIYVDSDDSELYFYNGSTWEQISP
jgi:hypothetical protein